MSGDWQPISTAPKGDDPVLGFVPTYFQGKGGIAIILWYDGEWWDNWACITEPTHWMPLPAAPGEGR